MRVPRLCKFVNCSLTGILVHSPIDFAISAFRFCLYKLFTFSLQLLVFTLSKLIPVEISNDQ